MKLFPLASHKPVPVLILAPEIVPEALELKPLAVEFRADLFRDRSLREMKATMGAFKTSGSTILLTIRRKKDGGTWPDSLEPQRRALMEKLMHAADAVDLELDLLSMPRAPLARAMKKARTLGIPVFVSLHSMKRMPSIDELDEWLTLAQKLSASRFKIAGFAAKRSDAERLARWALECSSPVLPITAVAMGKAGSWTRWKLPLLLGGPAYAPLRDAVAPGQIAYRELEIRCQARTKGTKKAQYTLLTTGAISSAAFVRQSFRPA